jgi:hypothetical protein
MLDALKRLFTGKPGGTDWGNVSKWAQSRQCQFKRVPDVDGFAIDGHLGGLPWRMEWGPPQRAYITSRELRLRMEMNLPQDLQMMVISLSLLEALELQTFEDFTQGNQTYAGSALPEEMRWLSMWPRATLSGQRELRQHMAALGADPAFAEAWTEGPLGMALARARAGLLEASPPFMLMCQRGRLYLRMEAPQVDAGSLGEALGLFEVAATEALRTAKQFTVVAAPGLDKPAA